MIIDVWKSHDTTITLPITNYWKLRDIIDYLIADFYALVESLKMEKYAKTYKIPKMDYLL